MDIASFLDQLNSAPDSIRFEDTMAVIEANYAFTPCAFRNGDIENSAEQNLGSCKLLAFARLQGLSQEQALACFGQYYREDVLQNPEGTDHQNIRNFMRSGWDGVSFAQEPLQAR